MPEKPEASFGKIILFMAVFVLAGLPLVAFLWETLNDLLALKPVPDRVINSIPTSLIFAGLLVYLSNRIKRLTQTASKEADAGSLKT